MNRLITRSFAGHTSSVPVGKTLVELFYDIISPYAYIQFELLTRQRTNWPTMALRHTPALLGGVMRGSANNSPPINVPAKRENLMRDMDRLSQFHKIPFKMYPNFPEFALKMGSLKSQRFLTAIQPFISESQYEQLIRHFFQSLFSPSTSLDISDENVIRRIAGQVGLDKSIVDNALGQISTEPIKKQLIDNSQRVVEAGGFGLPVTLLHMSDGTQMVFGSDRLHIIGHLLGEPNAPVLK